MKHTPTPWHFNAIKDNRIIGDETVVGPIDKIQINGANNTIATVYRKADAAFMRCACNNFEALLEAAKKAVLHVESTCKKEGDPCPKCDLYNAISKAESEETALRS